MAEWSVGWFTFKLTGMAGAVYRILSFLVTSSAKLISSALDVKTAPIFCHVSKESVEHLPKHNRVPLPYLDE